jgi:hypothetical protein
MLYVILGVVLLVLAAGGVWYRLRSRPFAITLSAAQIQKVMDGQLPFTTDNGVTISKATIDLSGNQAVADFVLTYTNGTVYTVVGNAAGTVRYDSQSASFYINPTELRINDVSHNDFSFGQAVGSLIDYFSGSPEQSDARKQWLAGMAGAAVQAVVRAAAGDLFARMPVYTLPNDKKGKAARMLLNDVQVRDGKLHLLLGGK